MSAASDLWLDLRLLLRRTSYTRLLAGGLLCCAGILSLVAVPGLEQKIEALRLQADTFRHAPDPTEQKSQQQARYEDFVDRLAAIEERPTILKALFETSASSGIVLSQAEYQLQRNDLGRYYRLRMSIPVTASYPKLRTFLGTVLEEIPSATIDEITLHRETVNSPEVNANLKLSIYFKDGE